MRPCRRRACQGATPSPSRLTAAAAGSTAAVRLVDVARVARVAPITVSRALREPDKVSPETRARVERAVAQTGYVPDLVASSLTRGRTRLVGIIVPTLTASIYAATVAGLAETLRAHDFEALIGDSGYTLEGEEKLVAAFLGAPRRRPRAEQRRARGSARAACSSARGVPVVETGNLTPTPIDMVVGFSQRATPRATCCAISSHAGIARSASSARHARRTRRRRIGAAPTTPRSRSTSLHARQRSPSSARPTSSQAAHALERIVAAHPDVSAVFAASEVRAIGALLQCQRRGWPVPRSDRDRRLQRCRPRRSISCPR